MSTIEYRTGSVFDAPMGHVLVHAVNCKGIWGSGVALEMRARYPNAYKQYQEHCDLGWVKPGDCEIVMEGGNEIVCLFNSDGYGNYVDSPSRIIYNTKHALYELNKWTHSEELNFSSPKINSGLFKVPWERTEQLINEFLSYSRNKRWFVWIK